MIKDKIVMNATNISSSGVDGLSRYTGELLQNLMKKEEKIIAYTTLKKIKDIYTDKIKLIPFSYLNDGVALLNYDNSRNFMRFLWSQTYLPVSLKKENTSLFYSTTPEGMLLPVCKQVITIHDVVPLLFPEFHPRYKYYYQWILPNLIKASKAIITISESTKRDIEKHYNVHSKPLHVVYQGYREDIFHSISGDQVEKVKNNYNLNNFILCVGETRPYKNIRRLIEAFAKVNLPSLKLAVVGRSSKKDGSLINLPQELGIADKVKFLGYVPDEDLVALYNGAKSFVFPSLYEGFGIPLLEAMACGCPVVASKVSSLPEVCGDAAYYIDPYDTDSIAEGVYKVTTNKNLQVTLREKGFERIKIFSYQKASDKIVDILNYVVRSRTDYSSLA